MKKLIDELVPVYDCEGNEVDYVWKSEFDKSFKPLVWNETFECWTKDYTGLLNEKNR